jgi:hypothetical protein
MKQRVGLILLTTMVLGGMLLSGVVLAKQCNLNCNGSNRHDIITGSNGNNEIHAKGGKDVVKGLRGTDSLFGGADDDTLFGGPGVDSMYGETGIDSVKGKGGNDNVYGIEKFRLSSTALHKQRIEAAAKDRKVEVLIGDRGNDTFRARDGKRDIIRGGPGHDTAYVDSVDTPKGVEEEVVPDGPNKTPVAKDDDSYLQPGCGNQSGYLEVGLPGVLGNDTDADNQGNTNFGLTVEDANPNTPEIDPGSGPSNATLTLNADGSFIYEATDGVAHPASFTYKVTDGAADSNEAKVTIGVDNSSCEP